MQTQAFFSSVATRSAHRLRGDYAAACGDYSVAQDPQAYDPAAQARWRRLYRRQADLLPGRACQPFVDALARLDCADRVPDLARQGERLHEASGWSLVAVPGLIPDEAFFAHLSQRRFPVTVWLRAEHEFDYIVEPDVFHDFFGHVPMLTEPAIAEFVAAFGEAGMRTRDPGARQALARLYWYTIEFGLVREAGGVRAFGAGLLSSPAELQYAIEAPDAVRRAFDAGELMRSAYRIDGFQQRYFVVDSLAALLDEGRAAMRGLAS